MRCIRLLNCGQKVSLRSHHHNMDINCFRLLCTQYHLSYYAYIDIYTKKHQSLQYVLIKEKLVTPDALDPLILLHHTTDRENARNHKNYFLDLLMCL